MVCYSTRKSSKWGVCSLQGSFDLPNDSDQPWWPYICIEKVLTDVHEKVLHFWLRNPDQSKNGVLKHTKIVEIRGMLASELVWPSKWVGQTVMANRMQRQGLDGCPQKFSIFNVGIWITQKMVCYSIRKSSKWGVCSLRGSFDPPNGPDKPWWPTVWID